MPGRESERERKKKMVFLIDPTWNFSYLSCEMCQANNKNPTANGGWNERRKRKEELEVRPAESGRGFKPERMQIAYTFNAHCIYVCVCIVG